MLTRVIVLFRRLRRLTSRNEWAIRLLRLKKREKDPGNFGLVMVQIDGLSRKQLERAMKNGRMPFLSSLSRKERYAVYSHYSGVPSNTPAVQAELFYGVKTAIPAFQFLDRRTGRTMRMYDNAAAQIIEARLRESDPGLLANGSSYCNIFCGGAEEAHFCADNNGWKGLWHAANPWTLPFLAFCYLDIFIRTAVLMVVEFVLALWDCVRGTLRGHGFWKEFEFIAARVMACVFLRELIVAGVCMDIARGLPVVHVNFIGYDEQSHRRGPSSSFAHWSLGGIDDSIRRIWNAAKRADHCDYDVWVYSDHGQERVRPYSSLSGLSLEESVKKIFGEKTLLEAKPVPRRSGSGAWRAAYLDEKMPLSWAHGDETPAEISPDSVLVTAMGPVGHIYLSQKLADEDTEVYAQRLTQEGQIPLVMTPAFAGKASAWTPKGKFLMPDDAEMVLGAEHPFLEEVAKDLVDVCAHENAGNFILLGWSEGSSAISFPAENGAHAGVGLEETHGFALLPHDVPLKVLSRDYIRPLDLRDAAARFLGKTEYIQVSNGAEASQQMTLRVMTYNVHGCVGMDGRLSTERIARVIARHNVDVVALQELDVGRLRSAGVDQAESIARKLEMKFHFHPTFRLKDGQFGNAIFSRHPMSIMKMRGLPKARAAEERGALWVTLDTGGMSVQFINTHLSIWPGERLLQAKSLVGPEWVSHPECQGPVVLCGDFNALPSSPAYAKLCGVLSDCQKMLDKHKPHRTWLGHYPLSRIDHVFLGSGWEVLKVEVPQTSLDRVASDHLPLIVELKYAPKDAKNQGGMVG